LKGEPPTFLVLVIMFQNASFLVFEMGPRLNRLIQESHIFSIFVGFLEFGHKGGFSGADVSFYTENHWI
jgi:hypothetical protein